jgi:uncharacterized protein (UPF0332 family)
VTEKEARREVVARLLEKAERALSAARRERQAGDLELAMNRVYYACFHAASAALLHEGREFVKHSGVRAAIHRDLIQTGKLAADLGRFYDEAFEARQEADYAPVSDLEPSVIEKAIEEAERFVAAMRRILTAS